MSITGHVASWGLAKPPPGCRLNRGHPLAQGLVLCVPFTEAIGLPVEMVRNVRTVLRTGANATAPTSRGGGFSSASGAALQVGTEGTDLTLPTDAVTVMVAKWRTQGTNKESGAFGFDATNATSSGNWQCQAHLPWVDGTVYWDFGDWTAGNRLSVAGLTIGRDDIWTFTAGRRGMRIYQNTVLRASSATAVTRVANTQPFSIGNWLYSGSKYWPSETEARYSFFYLWSRELDVGEIVALNTEPYAFLVPR